MEKEMKAVCYKRKGVLDIVKRPVPLLQHPDDVLIRVDYVSICGSDVEKLYGKIFEKEQPDSIMCHEASGTVVALGQGAKKSGLMVGDRVSGNPYHSCGTCHRCQSGYPEMCNHLKDSPGVLCEYVVWRADNIVKLPEKISLKQGTLTELVGTCLHAIDLAEIHQGESVLIIGAGGGGLLLLQLALRSGASVVVVMEPVASKREIALSMGADLAVDPNSPEGISEVSRLTYYRGYDHVIEASGDIRMVERGFNLLARHGSLLVYSKHGGNSVFNMYEFYIKEATVRTSYMSPFKWRKATQIMPKLNLDAILTAEFPFDRAQEAFEAHLSGQYPRISIRVSEEAGK